VNVSYDEAVAFCNWASRKFDVDVRLPTEAEWEYSGMSRKPGNMWEWVSDYYSKDYYSISPLKNPTGPSGGSKRVVRGGSWTSNESQTVVRRRSSRDPRDRNDQLGFRVVVDSTVKH